MEVTFTKLSGRRYEMNVVRERGPQLAPRQGPGYHDYLPHDAVHFLVEAEAGLSSGVFGQIAAGRNNLFTTADPALRRHQARREAKHRPLGTSRAEMARSESLASLCVPLWELRTGRRLELPEWRSRIDRDPRTSPVIQRILARLDSSPGAGTVCPWAEAHPVVAAQPTGQRRVGGPPASHSQRDPPCPSDPRSSGEGCSKLDRGCSTLIRGRSADQRSAMR